MSPEGLKRLIAREGFKTTAYRDTKGIWTIGVGHTAAAGGLVPKAGMKITEAQVSELFAVDIKQYEKAVRDAIKVPLADHQFDSLVSLCFNIGTGGFTRSTLVKRISAGASKTDIANAFLMWNKPSEIIGRRKTEVVQYLDPYTNSQKSDALGSSPAATKPSVGPTVPKVPLPAPEAPKEKQEGYLLKFLKGLF